MEITRRQALAGVGAGLLGAVASCTSTRRRPVATTVPPTTKQPAVPLRIGYVAEVTGPNAQRGQFVATAFAALRGYLANRLGDRYRGTPIELVPADAPTAADGPRAYSDLVGRGVRAILWCSPFGLFESLPGILGGATPVISVLADPFSASETGLLTGSRAAGSPLFQTCWPARLGVDLLCSYLSEDRGFSTAALLFDKAAAPGADALFATSTAHHGLVSRGVFALDTAHGRADWAAAVSSLKSVGAHAVFCFARVEDVAVVATQLQSLDAKYKDTPTTLRAPFKPMLVGDRWGTGDPSFPRLAGDAAARGTMSTTSLGSLMTLPSLPVRGWLHDYVPAYNGGLPAGAENGPCDAVAVVADAALRARSTSGPDLIAALESGPATMFASSVGVSFAPDRHVSVTADDGVLTTLDWPPEPYQLGQEWHDLLPGGYQGPNHLVDFTVAANTRAHPTVMADLLSRRYGISATDAYQGDPGKVAACKAVH